MHAHMLICKFTEITIYEDKPSYKAPSYKVTFNSRRKIITYLRVVNDVKTLMKLY